VWWFLNVSTRCSTFLPAALLSVNFQSRIFHPCYVVRHFPVLQIQRPLLNACMARLFLCSDCRNRCGNQLQRQQHSTVARPENERKRSAYTKAIYILLQSETTRRPTDLLPYREATGLKLRLIRPLYDACKHRCCRHVTNRPGPRNVVYLCQRIDLSDRPGHLTLRNALFRLTFLYTDCLLGLDWRSHDHIITSQVSTPDR